MSEIKLTNGSIENAILTDGKLVGGYVDNNGYISAKGNGTIVFADSSNGGVIDASGNGSFAHGFADNNSTISVSGNGAVATGYTIYTSYIKAIGDGAHAEGCARFGYIDASGWGAHAEGYANYGHLDASGNGAHAEGITTKALADGAHAEGYETIALGEDSHAEGKGIITSLSSVSTVSGNQFTLKSISTMISGQSCTLQVGDIVNCDSSYAKVITINTSNSSTTITTDKELGVQTGNYINLVKGISYGTNAHSEGYLTAATENYAHSEGDQTSAYGTASHAEGQYTIASGIGTHVEGVSSWALADGAHAEGNWTTAEGEYSHAEGYYTYASGAASHAEGKGKTAAFSSVKTVSTEGSNYLYELSSLTTTISNKSYTLQVGNTVNFGPNYAKITAIDNQTITTDKDLVVKAGYTINLVIGGSFGDSAHSEGYLTSATGDYSHAEGYNTIASGAASHAGGHILLGGSINADGDGSFAHGHTTNGSISATGKGAVAIGWAGGIGASKGIIKASGGGAHAEGYASRGIIDASGNGAHAEGCNTAALAKGAHAEGRDTTASGDYSHAEGYHTEANNQGEHAEGKYNQSHKGQTIHSIGIGTTKTDRKNAFEIMQNGDAYLIGVGNYDGIYIKGETGAPSGLLTLQETVNGKQDALQVGNGIDITDNIISITGYTDNNSIANGTECAANGENSHAEGYLSQANGPSSHAEGVGTVANNDAEHAQGKYNYSHGDTIVSVGIGDDESVRKNAFEITQNGDIYIYGLGNYDGTLTKTDDPAIMTLQDILKTIADATGVDIGAMF